MSLAKIAVPVLVFVIPLTVYLYTLTPGIAPGDSTEMVTAAIVLGVPHQPSYPVNTLLGYLASRQEWLRKPSFDQGKLSFQTLSLVERVNAVSALLQALTVVVFYFLIMELFRYTGEHRNLKDKAHGIKARGNNGMITGLQWVKLVAFSASMYLAFSLIFWQYATKFEVFPLNNLLAVVLLLVAVRIARRSTQDKQEKNRITRERRSSVLLLISRSSGVLLLAFLAGLALTHHQTIILVFPAIMVLLWKDIVRLLSNVKGLIVSLVALLLGMAPFFLLLIWMAARKPPLNWGEVGGIEGAWAALTRKDFGTFSSYLVGFGPETSQAPVEQVSFYFTHTVFDFSIVGVVFVAVGIWYLWQQQRRLFWFVGMGVLTGLAFLMYANFPLLDSFNQATVLRFQMLPNMFMAIFLAFGLFAINSRIMGIRSRQLESRVGLFIGSAFLGATFLLPFFMNFSKASQRGNDLAQIYLKQAFALTPDNALVMLSGDIPNMTMDYFRLVELSGKDRRISFSPGQFHLSWFIPQLLRKYPELVIPPPQKGKQFTSTTQVVDANYGRWPIYVGPDLVVHDPELDQKYTLYPKHLLFLVKRKGEDINLEEWRDENQRLWEGIDLSLFGRLKKNTPLFEETILFQYTRHFFNVGYVYEEVGLYEDAVREYQRVLEIDPYFKEALAALGRVYGEKVDPRDYLTAIDYLVKYQSVLKKGEEEYGMAAQAKIYEYQEKAMKESTQEKSTQEEQDRSGITQEGDTEEATDSGARSTQE